MNGEAKVTTSEASYSNCNVLHALILISQSLAVLYAGFIKLTDTLSDTTAGPIAAVSEFTEGCFDTESS
jgi:hypothetical protein